VTAGICIGRRAHVGIVRGGCSLCPMAANLELVGGAGDLQRPRVVSLVTRTAGQHEVGYVVATAIDAVDKMMDLQSSSRPAPRYTAATAVATPHQPRDAGWDILVRALRRSTVDGADVLRIAGRAVDRGGADRDLGASTVLPTLTAALAHGHDDLKLRAAGGLGHRSAVEHRAA
jgi:hypothetical protein